MHCFLHWDYESCLKIFLPITLYIGSLSNIISPSYSLRLYKIKLENNSQNHQCTFNISHKVSLDREIEMFQLHRQKGEKNNFILSLRIRYVFFQCALQAMLLLCGIIFKSKLDLFDCSNIYETGISNSGILFSFLVLVLPTDIIVGFNLACT